MLCSCLPCLALLALEHSFFSPAVHQPQLRSHPVPVPGFLYSLGPLACLAFSVNIICVGCVCKFAVCLWAGASRQPQVWRWRCCHFGLDPSRLSWPAVHCEFWSSLSACTHEIPMAPPPQTDIAACPPLELNWAGPRLLVAEGTGAVRWQAQSSPPALRMRKALRGGGKGQEPRASEARACPGGQHTAGERAGPWG